MVKLARKISGLLLLGSFLLTLGSCSIFKEDDCGCPTFGQNPSHKGEEVSQTQARK